MRFRGEDIVVLNWLDRKMLGTSDHVLQVGELACMAAVEACYQRQQTLAASHPIDPGGAIELAIRQEFVDWQFGYLVDMAVRQGLHQMGFPDCWVVEPEYPPPRNSGEEL